MPEHIKSTSDCESSDWPPDYLTINRATYDALAEEYRGRIVADQDRDKLLIKPFIRLLRERFNESSIRVIDVGCGGGLNLAMFAENGFDVTGLDFSKRMLDVAHDSCPSANLIHGNVLDYPLLQKSFEGVFAKAIIHLFTLQDARLFLSRIHGILVPGGIFYVTTTIENEIGAGLKIKMDYAGKVARYRRSWPEHELLKTIGLMGFKVLETSCNIESSRGKTWFNVWAEKIGV